MQDQVNNGVTLIKERILPARGGDYFQFLEKNPQFWFSGSSEI